MLHFLHLLPFLVIISPIQIVCASTVIRSRESSIEESESQQVHKVVSDVSDGFDGVVSDASIQSQIDSDGVITDATITYEYNYRDTTNSTFLEQTGTKARRALSWAKSLFGIEVYRRGATSSHDKSQGTNINGGTLAGCSPPDSHTAATGFHRTGQCVDAGNDDAGSHHICVHMSADFCVVTGQDNWCVEKHTCMDNHAQTCAIGNWCVCQWAYAR